MDRTDDERPRQPRPTATFGLDHVTENRGAVGDHIPAVPAAEAIRSGDAKAPRLPTLVLERFMSKKADAVRPQFRPVPVRPHPRRVVDERTHLLRRCGKGTLMNAAGSYASTIAKGAGLFTSASPGYCSCASSDGSGSAAPSRAASRRRTGLNPSSCAGDRMRRGPRPTRAGPGPTATCPRRVVALCVHHRVDRIGDLACAERNPPHEIEAGCIDEELRPDELQKLAEVDLGDGGLTIRA